MRWVCLGKREVSEVVGPLALALPILPHLTPLGSLIQFSPLKVSSGIGVRVSRSCHSQLDNDPILPGTPTRRGRLPLVWGCENPLAARIHSLGARPFGAPLGGSKNWVPASVST
jgi:hypothetical protein